MRSTRKCDKPSPMLRCGAYRIRHAFVCLVMPLLVHAEQLPIRIYRTADGLAQNSVDAIATDKNGYLWFGTAEGVSRFDGYEFTNYGVNEGLPHAAVNALLVTSDGGLWAGTTRGLCRFNPENQPPSGHRSTIYRPTRSATPGHLRISGGPGRLHLVRHSRRSLPAAAVVAIARAIRPGGCRRTQERGGDRLLVDRQGALWMERRHYGISA